MPEPTAFTEDDARLVAQRLDALVPYDRGWGSSVAICIQRGRTWQAFGSGTLLRIADRTFVVTAAHVLKDNRRQNLCVVPADSMRLVHLEGTGYVIDDEALDIAIIQLLPDVAEQLDAKAFVRLGDVSTSSNLDMCMFALFGFPIVLSCNDNQSIKLTKFHFVAPAYDGSTSALGNYNPQNHILLAANRANAKSLDGTPMAFTYQGGMEAPFPRELGGISGCGVWKIADSPLDACRTTADKARLVGVETAVYHESECIKVTRWTEVISLIRSALPELEPAISMWRPL